MTEMPGRDPVTPYILTVDVAKGWCDLINRVLKEEGVAHHSFHNIDDTVGRLNSDIDPVVTGLVISPFGGKYVTVIEHAEELAKEREMEAGMSFVVITSSPQTRIRAAQMGARVFSNNDLKVSQMQTESQRAYKLNELVRFVAPQANIRDTRTVQRRR